MQLAEIAQMVAPGTHAFLLLDTSASIKRRYPDPDGALEGWACRILPDGEPMVEFVTAMIHAIRRPTYVRQVEKGNRIQPRPWHAGLEPAATSPS